MERQENDDNYTKGINYLMLFLYKNKKKMLKQALATSVNVKQISNLTQYIQTTKLVHILNKYQRLMMAKTRQIDQKRVKHGLPGNTEVSWKF